MAYRTDGIHQGILSNYSLDRCSLLGFGFVTRVSEHQTDDSNPDTNNFTELIFVYIF